MEKNYQELRKELGLTAYQVERNVSITQKELELIESGQLEAVQPSILLRLDKYYQQKKERLQRLNFKFEEQKIDFYNPLGLDFGLE